MNHLKWSSLLFGARGEPQQQVHHAAFPSAVAPAHLGRTDEARAAPAAGLALDPTFNLASFRAAELSDGPYYFAWRERIIEGMRKPGVPGE